MMEKIEKVREFLKEVQQIEVDTSRGCYRGDVRYWMGGKKIKYTLSPELGIVVSIYSADYGSPNLRHDQYSEFECGDKSQFLCYINKLVNIVKKHGISSRYDFSYWEDLEEDFEEEDMEEEEG